MAQKSTPFIGPREHCTTFTQIDILTINLKWERNRSIRNAKMAKSGLLSQILLGQLWYLPINRRKYVPLLLCNNILVVNIRNISRNTFSFRWYSRTTILIKLPIQYYKFVYNTSILFIQFVFNRVIIDM